jgi:hypothetical protein
VKPARRSTRTNAMITIKLRTCGPSQHIRTTHWGGLRLEA